LIGSWNKKLLEIKENEEGIFIKIRVQPKASKNEIKGLQGDALKVRLTAPPVEGAANQACIDFFAKLCNIPRLRVEIVSGLTGRNKTVFIRGMQKEDFCSIIKEYV